MKRDPRRDLYVWLLSDEAPANGLFYRHCIIMVHNTDVVVYHWAGMSAVQWESRHSLEAALAAAAAATDSAVAEDGLTLQTPDPICLEHDYAVCEELANQMVGGAEAVDKLLRMRLR